MNMYKTVGLPLFIGGFLTFIGSGLVDNFMIPKETPTVQMYKATQQLDEALNNPRLEGSDFNLETIMTDVKTELETLRDTKEVAYRISQTKKVKKLENYWMMGALTMMVPGSILILCGSGRKKNEENKK